MVKYASLPFLVGIATCTASLSAPTYVRAQHELSQVIGQPAPTHLALHEALELSSYKAKRLRRLGGWSGVISGVMVLGLAGWRLLASPNGNDFSRGLGVMFVGVGTTQFGAGVSFLAKPSSEERLFSRLQTGSTSLDEAALARLEGAFEQVARQRHNERKVVRWIGLAKALGGGLVMTSVPFANDLNRESRRTGYIASAVLAVTGLAAFGSSFAMTPTEKAWQKYDANSD